LRLIPYSTLFRSLLRLRGDPSHVDHEAWIYAIVAGGNAAAAVGADLGPALRLRRSGAAAQEIEGPFDHRGRIGCIDAGRRDHRAGLDAFAAPGACVENVFHPTVQSIQERGTGSGHHRSPAVVGPDDSGEPRPSSTPAEEPAPRQVKAPIRPSSPPGSPPRLAAASPACRYGGYRIPRARPQAHSSPTAERQRSRPRRSP